MDAYTLFVKFVADMEGFEKDLNEAGEKTKSFGSSLQSTLGTVGKAVAGATVAAVSAAAAGITALTKSAVESYAEYEQLVGGIETLFGAGGQTLQEYADSVGLTVSEAAPMFQKLIDAQNEVQENAANAWKTAGLSANEYMDTVTSFSAALLQALDGDSKAAAAAADMAITDMADNANKMGTAMESIQTAYQGFAKQNYTMLDNLKLGYGGTKEEMERLLADAQAISGIEYNIESYADIVDAIHVIQTEMGITGTTAKEASSTISGSLASMKSAWQNVLTGIADENADFGGQIDNLVESVGTFADNIIPRIEIALGGIGELVTQLAPKIVEKLPELVEQVLPMAITSIETLLGSILDVLPSLVETIVNVAPQIVTAISKMLPQLLKAGITILLTLVNGIGKMAPTLIPTVVSTILELITTILSENDEIFDAALVLIEGLADGIVNAIPVLIEALPAIIEGIIETLLNFTSAIMEAAAILLLALADAIPTVIIELNKALPDIIYAIIEAFQEAGPEMGVACVELLSALLIAIPEIIAQLAVAIPDVIVAITNGFKDGWPDLVDNGMESAGEFIKGFSASSVFSKIKEKIQEIVDKIKENFEKYFSTYKDIGKNIISGLIEGIGSMASNVKEKVTSVAESVSSAFKGFFGIASPSKLFKEFGRFIDEGLAIGIESNTDDVFGAMRELEAGIGDFNTSLNAGELNVADAKRESTKVENNITVTLEGEMADLFKAMIKQNNQYIIQNGDSAFV